MKFPCVLALISFFLLSYVQPATAVQADFIVTLKGDTVYGKIRSANLHAVRFESFQNKEVNKIEAEEIRGYYKERSKRYYGALRLPGESSALFLERLEDGEISLFEYFKSTGAGISFQPGLTSSTHIRRWYAKSSRQPLAEIKTNWSLSSNRSDRKEAFMALIAGNRELAKEFRNENAYDWELIRIYINRFNRKFKKLGTQE